MMILKFIVVLCLWSYAGIMLYAAIGFIRSRIFKGYPEARNVTPVTIIICARNEDTNIERCLTSIIEQQFDHSLLEVILVNDASSDRTLFIAENVLKASHLNYQIINNPAQTGKKRSITAAIEICKGDLIITRDADTYTESKLWLKTIVDFHELSKKEFIIGTINYQNKNNFLSQLQYFENSALTVLSGGFTYFKKPFLCSGANLAFTRSLFIKTKGYKSHETIASGDDVLFLEDVKKVNSSAIAFLKQNEATVYTYPEKKLKDLLFQKIRWASKSDQNPNKFNGFLGFLVLLVHFFSVFALFLPFFTHHIPRFSVIFILSRFLIDFLLLFLASRYFKKPVNWLWFVPLSLFYSVYILVTGLLSLFVKPNWK